MESSQNTKRVRTGCLTCKLRKVKCDESKPCCIRCQDSGRSCAGYPAIPPRAKRKDSGVSRRPGSSKASEHGGGSSGTDSIASGSAFNEVSSREMVLASSSASHASASSETRDISAQPKLPNDTQIILTVFQRRVVPAFPLSAERYFWATVMPRLALRESPVVHALAAMNEFFLYAEERMLLRPRSSGEGRGLQSAYAQGLEQYNRAINDLTERSTGAGSTSYGKYGDLHLLCSLIFAHIEILSGRHEACVIHVERGLQLLQLHITEQVSDDSALLDRKCIDVFITPLLQRLSLMCMSTGYAPASVQFLECRAAELTYGSGGDGDREDDDDDDDDGGGGGDGSSDSGSGDDDDEEVEDDDSCQKINSGNNDKRLHQQPYRPYVSLDEALARLAIIDDGNMRAFFEVSGFRMLSSQSITLGQSDGHQDEAVSSNALGDKYTMKNVEGTSVAAVLSKRLGRWDARFSALEASILILPSLDPLEKLKCDLIRIHGTVSEIRAIRVSQQDGSESTYDQLDSKFSLINRLATNLLAARTVTALSQSQISPSFKFDPGIIHPLWFTLTKCRRRLIRRTALAVIEKWPDQEAFWNPTIAARAARCVIKSEDADALDEQYPNDSLPPESKRVHASRFIATDCGTKVTVFMAKKPGGLEAEWQLFREEC